MLGNYLSVNEAANMLSLTVGRIRQLLLAEEIRGHKVNEKAWVIDLDEVKRFAKNTNRPLKKPENKAS